MKSLTKIRRARIMNDINCIKDICMNQIYTVTPRISRTEWPQLFAFLDQNCGEHLIDYWGDVGKLYFEHAEHAMLVVLRFG